jgi:hypothetical protein
VECGGTQAGSPCVAKAAAKLAKIKMSRAWPGPKFYFAAAAAPARGGRRACRRGIAHLPCAPNRGAEKIFSVEHELNRSHPAP